MPKYEHMSNWGGRGGWLSTYFPIVSTGAHASPCCKRAASVTALPACTNSYLKPPRLQAHAKHRMRQFLQAVQRIAES